MKILLKTIPHKEQRYPTVGDWLWTTEGLEIRVSLMNNWRYESLVVFHELCEVLICQHMNVSQLQVDEFDIMFEKERELGQHSQDAEPGDDPRAPYRLAHFIATNCERILAVALGVDWGEYCAAVESL